MKKIRDFFYNSFLYLLAIELVEEVLEEFIAWWISGLLLWVVMKAVSAVIVITLTQTTKVLVKRLIKQITYKEGNDKMNKIKQFFTWIFSNKKTLLGIGSSAVGVLTGTGVIDIASLPELLIGGFNLTPILFWVVLGVFLILGVTGKGFEKIKEFFARKEAEKSEKELKALRKEAKKELKAEEKKANQTQAQAEKEQAKADKANAEKLAKEKADAEHKAKLDAMKNTIKAEEKAKAEAQATKA